MVCLLFFGVSGIKESEHVLNPHFCQNMAGKKIDINLITIEKHTKKKLQQNRKKLVRTRF